MKSRIHLALGAVCVASICAISIGASEQAPAGAVAEQARGKLVVATVCGQRIKESELQLADEALQAGLTPSELRTHRSKVLTCKVIFIFRQRFVATEDASPTALEIEEAAKCFRTRVRHARCGMTQREIEERLASLEADAEAARATQQPHPALQEEIDEVRGYLKESKVDGPLMSFLIAQDWKFQRALHRKYGGRAWMGESGPEAIDAMRAWLKDAAAQGDLGFANDADRDAFWTQFPTPDQPIPSELENPDQVFETVTAYMEANAPDR